MSPSAGTAGAAGGVLEGLASLGERTWNDPEYGALKAFRDRGPDAQVFGCFPVYVPDELVHAAGFLPVHVFGGGQLVEIDHADSRIQSFVCSICRSTLELGLLGKLDSVGGMMFPSICDVARNLSGVWKRNFPGAVSLYIHWPEHAASVHARRYVRGEFERVARELGALRGRELSTGELNASLDVYNRSRVLVRRLYALRRAHPEKVSLAESYQLLRAAGFMRREEHNALLAAALGEAEARPTAPRDYVRVIVEGAFCEQPPLELLQCIEEAGCYVVDDDLLLGLRWYPADVPADTDDPLGALADAFLAGAPSCAVHHGGDHDRVRTFGDKVEAAGVNGVIFAAAKFCEPALYDYVLLKEELERRKIPYLSFEFEEKMTVFDTVRVQVETFVESVLFFAEEPDPAAGGGAAVAAAGVGNAAGTRPAPAPAGERAR